MICVNVSLNARYLKYTCNSFTLAQSNIQVHKYVNVFVVYLA